MCERNRAVADQAGTHTHMLNTRGIPRTQTAPLRRTFIVTHLARIELCLHTRLVISVSHLALMWFTIATFEHFYFLLFPTPRAQDTPFPCLNISLGKLRYKEKEIMMMMSNLWQYSFRNCSSCCLENIWVRLSDIIFPLCPETCPINKQF